MSGVKEDRKHQSKQDRLHPSTDSHECMVVPLPPPLPPKSQMYNTTQKVQLKQLILTCCA